MFRNKLIALEHPAPESVDCSNRTQFANTILWLEDQKIRSYKIDDREKLRNIKNTSEWEQAYAQYKKDVGVPNCGSAEEELSWLLSHAVRLEYLDNTEIYKINTAKKIAEASKPTKPIVASANPFDGMDMTTKDFENGVQSIASHLNIPHHPDHRIVLQAASRIIYDRLRPEALKESPAVGTPYSVIKNDKMIFDDEDMNQAAEILRLQQIQSIRRLQTSINETIVTIQELTADPRTDTKLGKVGY